MTLRTQKPLQTYPRLAFVLFMAFLSTPAVSAQKNADELQAMPPLMLSYKPAPPPKPVKQVQIKNYLSHQSGFDLNVRVAGNTLSKVYEGGRCYVAAGRDQDYQLVFTCPSSERYLAMCSVDGLDIVTGKPASASNTGYVIDHGSLVVPGFWLGKGQYARFRFGSPKGSYAAKAGRVDNIGVIAVKFFAERQQVFPLVEPEKTKNPRPGNPVPEHVPDPNRNPSHTHRPVTYGVAGSGQTANSAFVGSRSKPAGVQSSPAHDLGTEFGARVTVGQSETAPFLRGEQVSSLTIEYASPEQIRMLQKKDSQTSTPLPTDQSAGCKPPSGWKGE